MGPPLGRRSPARRPAQKAKAKALARPKPFVNRAPLTAPPLEEVAPKFRKYVSYFMREGLCTVEHALTTEQVRVGARGG